MNESEKFLTPEEQMQAMLADARRYRDEAKAARNEVRKTLNQVRAIRGALMLPEIEKGWVRDAIPAFPEPNATYDAGDRAFLICHENSSVAEFAAYKKALTDAGFCIHSEYAEGTVTALTAYNDRAVVNLTFSAHDNILRAVTDPAEKTALPPITPIPCGEKPVIFRQEADLFAEVDCGMSYTFRLSDGKLLVIDGGWHTAGIAERLYADMVRLSGGEEPVIAAWIFTHAHPDHIGAFLNFADLYADRVAVEHIIYSFPGESRMAEFGDAWMEGYLPRFPRAVEKFPTAKVIKARTGQVYRFAGMEIDMLYTFEDFKMPKQLHNFNDTSLVFRIRTAGKNWMFLGDVSEKGSAELVARYGEGLKSDIVQVAHHGYAGGTDELYDCIAAPVVLWPCPMDDPRNGNLRYSNPEWSPITRRMVEKYAKTVYVTAEGSTEIVLCANDVGSAQ